MLRLHHAAFQGTIMIKANTGVRVLFAGQYWPGANTLYIARAFEQCGAIVQIVNDTSIQPEWTTKQGRIVRRALRKAIIEKEWNEQLLWWTERFQPDLIYISGADFCWTSTLETIRRRAIPIVCFYHDVQWEDHQGSRFSQNISYFDLVATTRSWQEAEFRGAGARDVSIVRFGFDPLVHRPVEIAPLAMERYGADVTFIGTHESHRAKELESLVSVSFPYQFRLWGGYWERLPQNSPLRRYWQEHHVHESEIPIIYAASKVALHWVGWEPYGTDAALRKGDQHNSRTFQIAACGGALMVAQRTAEHMRFFAEDEEVILFDSVQELAKKLLYWTASEQDEERQRIANNARMRCLAEDYSYVPVVRSYLDRFGLPSLSAGSKV